MRKIIETLDKIRMEQIEHGQDHGDAEYIRMCSEALAESFDIEDFLVDVFEIAFGDGAIDNDYTYEEVVTRLREFSDDAWKYEELSK